MVNTILREADLFCPNGVLINFTICHLYSHLFHAVQANMDRANRQ
ncbi:ABC transporter ATP-binding protein [Lactobacillus delbrueckii subsp. lactis]|nr:ABC transporter ATP-binding protein [Lactobacillus delbrueckii subsp. lactis]MCT3515069.1 ABC transporter ATP-binding protein [Lactobacillus delbrueckii subsp. lactis]TLQ30311.1 ABC transporter ATP-binding protein [Lactobacillus delbrueckii subsp. lactis]